MAVPPTAVSEMIRDVSATANIAPFVCRGIRKGFAGIPVLKDINLELRAGEVVALAGENGAGKSTLLKIIAGQIRPDDGTMMLAGDDIVRYNATIAHRHGVSIVPQELAPVPDLAIYENIFLGRELRDRLGLLDRRSMQTEAGRMLTSFDLHLDPKLLMRNLTVALQQIIEIIKNTFAGSRVLLLDEPTSAISTREVERLYRIIDRLRADGVAIVYTTHKMEEIRATADRVIVLRDGNLIVDCPASAITDDGIVTAMIGRDLETLFPTKRVPAEVSFTALEVRDIRVDGFDSPISLDVRPREIVALAGLVGAGRTELLEAIFGARPRHGGTVLVGGAEIPNQPTAAIASKVGFVPEDRKNAGLVSSMSILENGILPHLSQFSSAGWLRKAPARTAVARVMKSVNLKHAGLTQPVSSLSGGNQQKVVLGRWLTQTVDVLLLDEPTRGVDVGARSEIYRIVADLAAQGMAILMASSDMPEVLGLAHRVLVIRAGAIVGQLSGAELDHPDAQNTIFRIAAGIAPESRNNA
jgi:ribose transport system ATP-binding protein